MQTKAKTPSHVALRWYACGFALSIFLTLVAFFLVLEHVLEKWHMLVVIASLGVIQAMVQLVFFLHLGREGKPRWNLTAFLFMAMVVIILVFGTVWIMISLNNRLMTPMETHNYMDREQGI